jgi:uncharacterized repeat protein (TIGR03806 family)
MTRSRSVSLRRAAAALALCGLTFGTARAPAQEICAPDAPVPFASHTFPLGPVPVLIDAFPFLTFTNPVLVTPVPGLANRLAVAERGGRVLVFANDPAAFYPDVLVDLSVAASWAPVITGGEQGVLGLAFDPDFATNGWLYVTYSISAAQCGMSMNCTRLVRLTAVEGESLSVDPFSARTLLQWVEPFADHKAAALAFGPDGMLWISSGDGGGSPQISAQNLQLLRGKVLRIDVHAGNPYAIPPDNPFAGHPTRRNEIFSYGLRAPRRFSFDRLTGDFWIGDAGMTEDEIDHIPFGLHTALNFGWNLCEGTHDVAGAGCGTAGLTAPLVTVSHSQSASLGVFGGYVYRGSRIPELYGLYVFGDQVTGRIWSSDPLSSPAVEEIGFVFGLESLGEDRDGDLLAVSRLDGKIYRFVAAGSELDPNVPQSLAATGLFADAAALEPAPGVVPFDVNVPGWASFASTRRWLALPEDGLIGFSPTGAWTFPEGTALVQQLDLPGASGPVHAETRVLLRQSSGWRGYSYQWSADQTATAHATAPTNADFEVDFGSGPQTLRWHFATSSECLGCHTDAGGRALGLRTRQVNRVTDLGAGPVSQLDHLACLGVFESPIGPASSYSSFPAPEDPRATLDQHARAYLDVNCASCHSPGAPAPGGIDLRFDTAVDATHTLFVPATHGDLGVPGGLRIRPGHHEASVLAARMTASDSSVWMPKLALLPDFTGAALVSAWIDSGIPGRDPDGDGVDKDEDNCPVTANPDQLDTDGDGVGDACDNCVLLPNPRESDTWLAEHPWSTLTGGQRDDDGDGFGNRCDAKFEAGGNSKNVAGKDLASMRRSLGKPVDGFTCGRKEDEPCGPYDLDQSGALIDELDLDMFRSLLGVCPGPKCESCPIDCAGPACGAQ